MAEPEKKRVAEIAMDEVREAAQDFNRTLDKLKATERGSERYYELLCADLSVKATILRIKAAGAEKESERLMNQRDRLERQQNARAKNHHPVRRRPTHVSDRLRRRAS